MRYFHLLKMTVLLLSAVSAHAQLEPISSTDYHTFGAWTKEDKSAIVFADAANVRAAADSKAELTGKIVIGTKVKILEVSTKTFTQKGIISPWIKVETAALTGYVWGGALTKQSMKLSDGRMALWGLTEITHDETVDKTFASVRIAEQGTLKLKQDFNVQYANREEGYLERYAAPKLEGAKDLIIFATPSEACGVYASMHYLLYTGDALHFVGSGYSMGDGGVLHTSLDFVFPYPEKEGEFRDYHYQPDEGHIFRIENDGEYDEECIWTETVKVASFTWDGSQLVKSCEE